MMSFTGAWVLRAARDATGATRGSPQGPNLLSPTLLWSDGSPAGLAKTIRDGVLLPKQFRSPMPPMGGAQLTPEQVTAVAAYLWALRQGSAGH